MGLSDFYIFFNLDNYSERKGKSQANLTDDKKKKNSLTFKTKILNEILVNQMQWNIKRRILYTYIVFISFMWSDHYWFSKVKLIFTGMNIVHAWLSKNKTQQQTKPQTKTRKELP